MHRSREARAYRSAIAVLLALGAVCLGGCQKQVAMKVESEIPAALVNELPVSVGVYFSGAFRAYEYVESSEERGSWRISSGESQVRAFSKVLNDLFSEYRELAQPADEAVDLVMIPRIDRMQFSLPEETGFDYFEAWVEYVVELRARDGTALPEWRFTGYGQAPRERFGNIEDGLSRSLGEALRNAGAQLATGLPSHAPVEERARATRL